MHEVNVLQAGERKRQRAVFIQQRHDGSALVECKQIFVFNKRTWTHCLGRQHDSHEWALAQLCLQALLPCLTALQSYARLAVVPRLDVVLRQGSV